MATFQAELPPIHNLGTAEEEVEKVKRYLVRLAEQLDYTINRLEPGSGEAAGLSATGVSPGSYGGGAQTPGFGDVFQVLSLVVDYYGRLTSVSEQNVTIPNTTATTTAAGLMSAADKTKVDSVEAGAAANVQPDWAEADTTSDAYIKNKPTIPPGSVVDSYLDPASENPVQNKVITAALGDLMPKTGGAFSGDISIETSGGASLAIVDSGGNKTTLVPYVWGGNKTVYLPAVGGTLALTSQIPALTDVTSTALSAADTSKATVGDLKLYAYGNIRILFGSIAAVNLPTTQTTVANIATGHRPVKQCGVSCAWDSARYSTWAVVGTGGALAVRSNSAYTSGNLRVNAIWVTE